MTCQDYDIELGDYVDGTADEPLRATIEAHLATCARCRNLVTDLSTLRQLTSDLEPALPSPRVWATLAEAIEAERGHWTLPSWGLGRTFAAAAVTITLVAGLSWLGSRLASTAPGPSGEVVLSAEFDAAEADFTRAIAGLEVIRQQEQTALDMETADVLQANLTVIDGAIDESRAALRLEPGSRVAQDSLFDALESKVALLQDVVALINEMRQVDVDGTAALGSGLNQ